MKVTLAPIVSTISGRFGGMVGTNWKGIYLFRRFQSPSNPNTTAQQNVRVLFRNLTITFTIQTARLRAAWDSFATGKRFIARNSWIGRNVAIMNGDANLNDMVATPGDASTLPPTNITVTPAAAQFTIDISTPALPTGWTITRIITVVWRDRDFRTLQPASAVGFDEEVDTTSPYQNVHTGLDAAALYQIAAFIEWLAPGAQTRYSASFRTTDTTL